MFSIITPPPAPLPSSSNHYNGRYVDDHGLRDEDAMDLDAAGLAGDGYLVDAFDEEDVDGAGGSGAMAAPGEVVTSATAFMRGHGTFVEDDQVVSSLAGTVERVNKLVSVRPAKTRYNPEVGDLVVGRITEVGPRRWKVDVGSRQDAVLMLSSVNLPGGVQRRKLESDELQMRTFFQEGDLLVAEVQAFFGDGSVSLHTRSLRYGKLRNGQLVRVPPVLMRRLKSHFYTLPCGVDLILGLNGYIWVSMHVAAASGEQGGDGTAGKDGLADKGLDTEGVYSDTNEFIPSQTRLAISRVSNLITLLARHNLPISDSIVAEAYDVSLDLVEDDRLDEDDGGGADGVMALGTEGRRTGVKKILSEDVGAQILAALAAR